MLVLILHGRWVRSSSPGSSEARSVNSGFELMTPRLLFSVLLLRGIFALAVCKASLRLGLHWEVVVEVNDVRHLRGEVVLNVISGVSIESHGKP